MGNLCVKDYDDENRLNNYPGYTGSPSKKKSSSSDYIPKNTYIYYNEMDDKNKKAMDVFQNEGMDSAIQHMITNENGKPRTYAEIRELYG